MFSQVKYVCMGFFIPNVYSILCMLVEIPFLKSAMARLKDD